MMKKIEKLEQKKKSTLQMGEMEEEEAEKMCMKGGKRGMYSTIV